MNDKRVNDDAIIADIVDDSVPNAEGFKPTLVFNSMHQSQQQNVAVDNTTVNNIFRSEMGGWKESIQKILQNSY